MNQRMNQIAVIGMGVMGANLARNFASRGYKVGIYNRTVDVANEVAATHPDADLDWAATIEGLLKRLERPRKIILMVSAGPAVDAVIGGLDGLLEEGDIVVDAGNSHYADTERRAAEADEKPWRFLGMGVSGGSEGALRGPSIMPGGDHEAWATLQPMLESAAAEADSGPCVTYCGAGSAGHFVKMVHNGIEYGDMQLIAESATLLRRGLGLGCEAVADVFSEWNQAELESYLIEITANIYRVRDPKEPSQWLIDQVVDQAGQKGTGRWTVIAAVELGVAIPTITAAVDARALSADKQTRTLGESTFSLPRTAIANLEPTDLRNALYAAKIASYTQGFELLRAASKARNYGTDFTEVARIWKAGCIIRAQFLDRVRSAFQETSERPLAFVPSFVSELRKRLPSLRKVCAAASLAGLPTPALGASLAYFDTLTTSRGSADLIQAQRDYFGSHTYARMDAPNDFIHTDWSDLAKQR